MLFSPCTAAMEVAAQIIVASVALTSWASHGASRRILILLRIIPGICSIKPSFILPKCAASTAQTKDGGVKSLNFIRTPKQQGSRAPDTGAAGRDVTAGLGLPVTGQLGLRRGGDLAADGVKGAEL